MRLLRLVLIMCCLLPASAAAYDVSARRAAARDLDGSQFKDFANEWALAASPTLLGPLSVAPAWEPQADLSINFRAVRQAPGSRTKLRQPEYAWVANPSLARRSEPSIAVTLVSARLGLPGDAQAGLLYGRSTNVKLQVAGADVSYPFLRPTLTSPGLWARVSYAYPSRLPGLRLHIPALGLYLTNEFVRTPVRGRPLTLHLHAGLQQAFVFALPQGLVERKALADGSEQLSKRLAVTFPASTQFIVGAHANRGRWSLSADAGYAGSESTFSGSRRLRAFWNQSYRLTYAWD
jgi:hypothetical protein